MKAKTKAPSAPQMGKPQKSHKHKKIRATAHYDPETVNKKHVVRKEQNQAPSREEVDAQHVPRAVREIMKLKQAGGPISSGSKKRKMHPKNAVAAAGMNNQDKDTFKPVKFKKGIRETEFQFRQRMETTCQNLIAKTQLEKKWKLPIDSIDQDGHITVKKSEKTKLKQKQRLEKLAVRKGKKAKIERQEEKIQQDFTRFSDKVEFGEVAMAPPTLSAKPRKSDTPSSDKFKRSHNGLLLNSILDKDATKESSGSSAQASSEPRPKKKRGTCSQQGQIQREPGQTVPRKQLTPLQRQQHDKARAEAVAKYRAFKEARTNNLASSTE